METIQLLDKVVLYKGRVWTVYSSAEDGVFCYQGLKPFSSFNYHEDSSRFSTFKKNTTYIPIVDLQLLDGEEISVAVKKEEKELKKKLNRKKAIDFYVNLTGHSKAFVSKHIHENDWRESFAFCPGAVQYDVWKTSRNGRPFLILSHNMEGHTHHAYFDFITFETDDLETDHSWEEIKQEIIDNYTDCKGIS